jgi:hypothetical protein
MPPARTPAARPAGDTLHLTLSAGIRVLIRICSG